MPCSPLSLHTRDVSSEARRFLSWMMIASFLGVVCDWIAFHSSDAPAVAAGLGLSLALAGGWLMLGPHRVIGAAIVVGAVVGFAVFLVWAFVLLATCNCWD
jgi:hypothetical protein